MIRTIMLTYRYTDVVPSTIVCLFFRMAGIYVIEKYFDSKINLREELIEFGVGQIGSLEEYCDAEIVLLSEKLDKEKFYKTKTNFDTFVEVCYGDASSNSQDGTNEAWLINEILDKLNEKGLVDENQRNDLVDLSRVFSTKDYIRTTMLTKYFFVFHDDDWTDSMTQKLKQIVQGLQQNYRKNKGYHHIKYALINTAYEVNLYRKRCEKNQIYSNLEIIDMANELEASTGRLLDRSLEILLAQVENNLLSDRSAYYYRLTELCRNDGNVNSYAFFLKGNYWMGETDYERAGKYYKNAIARFPEYYRAWYQLGNCFYKQGKVESARKAFSVVKRILTERYEKDVLRPMEVEYLYRACMYCGKIQESYSAFKTALGYYGFAKRVWETIETSEFIKRLERGRNGEEIVDFIPKIKKEFDISEIEKRIKLCKDYLGA